MGHNLYRRLSDLAENLGEFSPNDLVPREVAEVFNVLLEETKKVQGQDPVVASTKPIPIPDNEPHADTSCGALRAVATQLATAFRR
jgi:hypothetical protein